MPTLTANPEVPRGAAPTIEIAGRPPSKEKGKEKEKIADKMKAMRDRVAGRISKLLNRDKASGQEGLQELAKGELSQEKSKSRLSQAWKGAKSRVSAFRDSIKSTPAEQQQKETAREQKKQARARKREEGLERWNQFKTDSKEKWGKRKEAFDEKKSELKDKLSEKAISTAYNVAKEADKAYKNHLKNKERRMRNRENRRNDKDMDAVFNTLRTGEVDSQKERHKGAKEWKNSAERAHTFGRRTKLTAEAQAWAMSEEHRNDVNDLYNAKLRKAEAEAHGKRLSGRTKFKLMAEAIHEDRADAGDALKFDIRLRQRDAEFKQAVKDEGARQMLETGKKLTPRQERELKRDLLTKAVNGEPYKAEDIQAQKDQERATIMARPEYAQIFADAAKALSPDGKPLTTAQLNQAEKNAIDSIKAKDAAQRKADEEAVTASGKLNEKIIEMRSSTDPKVRNDPKLQEKAMQAAIDELHAERGTGSSSSSGTESSAESPQQQYEAKLKDIDARFNAGIIDESQRDKEYREAYDAMKAAPEASANASPTSETPIDAFQRKLREINEKIKAGTLGEPVSVALDRIQQEYKDALAAEAPEGKTEAPMDPDQALLEKWGLKMDSPGAKDLLAAMKANPTIAATVATLASAQESAINAAAGNAADISKTRNIFLMALGAALQGLGYAAAGSLELASNASKTAA